MKRLGWATFGLVLALAAQAQAAKLLAVLPLDVSHTKGKMDADAQASVEEMLRDVATNALTASGWTVLTGETTLQVLVDNGVDPRQCSDESCHLSMAREIKADEFLSGTVQYVEGEFTASIRLINTRTGRILASARVKGATVTALRDSFEAEAPAFFQRAGVVAGNAAPEAKAQQPAQPPAATAPTTGRLSVSTNVEAECKAGDRKAKGAPGHPATFELPPGHARLVCRSAGRVDATKDLWIAAGDDARIEVTLLVPVAAPPPPPPVVSEPTPAPAPKATAELPPAALQPTPQPARSHHVLAWVGIGAAVMVAAASVVFDTQASTSKDGRLQAIDFLPVAGYAAAAGLGGVSIYDLVKR